MKSLTIIEQQSGNQFTLYNSKLGSILRSFEGFEYPEVRVSIDDVAGPYGSVYITSKFGTRRMGIIGDLVSSDVFALRRNLLTVLRQTGVIKLIKFTTYDDMELQCEAEVTDFSNPYTHAVHTFKIELKSPDWRFYSQEEIVREIAQTSVRGGASIPTAIPMSFTLPSSGETDLGNIVVNSGNETTDPVFTITGPGTNFIVGNTTNDTEFTLNYALSEGDEIEVDVKNRTVLLNGLTNVYPDFDGDFWSLSPGENEIRFFVESGLTVNTKLAIAYRHAYSGI